MSEHSSLQVLEDRFPSSALQLGISTTPLAMLLNSYLPSAPARPCSSRKGHVALPFSTCPRPWGHVPDPGRASGPPTIIYHASALRHWIFTRASRFQREARIATFENFAARLLSIEVQPLVSL